MRTKSLQAPTGIQKGHEWLSPVGHSESWHRIWNGTAWENVDAEEDGEEENQEEREDSGESETGAKDSDETETKADVTSTEETKGERSNETAVSDRDRKQEPDAGAKRPADGKQGKGGKGKRK